MKAILPALLALFVALLLTGCLGSKFPPKVETTISWHKEGSSEQDYFQDLVEAEKHGAEVAGEPNYPPRPVLPEYIAPTVVINNTSSDKSGEKAREQRERDSREFYERSRISRERDQMGDDYNRQVARALQVVEDRRTDAIESFLGSRGWNKTVKTVEISFYENGQKKAEYTHKNDKLITAVAWKPNGEQCPHTNVVNGNGVMVIYHDDGTVAWRWTYKDGEKGSAKFPD